MNFLSITVILVSLLIIQEFHSIDGSVQQIYDKVKQEVQDLIDSQEYESVDDIVKDSKVKVKYLDYYVPTTVTSTPITTTTTPPSVKKPNKDMMTSDRDNGDPMPGNEVPKEADDEKDDGGAVIYIVVGVVVVIVLLVAVVGVFVVVRKSKIVNNRNILLKKKPKRSDSRQSLASIETVASDTGKPIHTKDISKSSKSSKAVSKPLAKKK